MISFKEIDKFSHSHDYSHREIRDKGEITME